MAKPYNKIYTNEKNISLNLRPQDTDNHEEYNITIIQEKGHCPVSINIHPEKDSLSKVNVRIFAENNASVNCILSCHVAKDASGVDTDMQIRSWPFDRSSISIPPPATTESGYRERSSRSQPYKALFCMGRGITLPMV